MAERICLLTFSPTKCKDDCFNCDCGGQGATKDMYVSINNVQRVCSITGGAADTDEGEYIAEVIRNNLETMVIAAKDVQPVNQWISIDERLPQDGEEALVYAGNRGVMIGLYDSVLQVWLDYECCGLKVTHWQPLPEPPKKEG